MLCGSVDERRAGEYMAEVRTSSQCERPCAGIEETRTAPGDAGGSSSPVNGDDHTGKRLAGKPHEPFERADGGRAKARPPPTLHCHKAGFGGFGRVEAAVDGGGVDVELQGARLPPPCLDPPHAAKALQSRMMFPDKL